ncbi:solute carrier family 35 member F2 isoform X2 [Gossypium hirsutum]|uniref:Solute carrier family 35 member F2 isoform X2 n=1 Tax=Gossypium hirsutum TaxID=3635 RepID=A0ABM2ZXS8_GOSHI|nr:solute carrier family 35 member F2 isoform X2 [Gossypium hirsutum]
MSWSNVGNWFKTRVTLKNLFRLFLGQLVSFVLALMSFTSSLIASLGVDAPITQTSFTYFALAVVYGSILLYRGQKLRIPWYWYLALGFVDVQGNYLGTRYSLWQLGGAALCVLGLGLVLLSDAGVGGGGGSKPILGDALVIAGTLFFAMSNVGEEFCVKKKDRIEVVSMIGLFGMLVSGVELSIFELKSLESVTWSTNIMLGFAGYTFSSFMFYTITPFVLKLSGATMFNLSLLTSDMWAVVVRILFYRQQVDWLYFVAFGVVVIGLVTYSTTEKVPATVVEDGSQSVEYQELNAESRDEC